MVEVAESLGSLYGICGDPEFLVVLFGFLTVVMFLRYHIKKNFSIAKIVSTYTMSVYLILCILLALSISYWLFEILNPEIDELKKTVVLTISLIGVYGLLFFPTYRAWKESLTKWVGSNPEEEIDVLVKKISTLMRQIDRNKSERDTLASISMKVDVMYYRQKLESLVKSRSTARFMNIFVIVCPAVLLIVEIIWILEVVS